MPDCQTRGYGILVDAVVTKLYRHTFHIDRSIETLSVQLRSAWSIVGAAQLIVVVHFNVDVDRQAICFADYMTSETRSLLQSLQSEVVIQPNKRVVHKAGPLTYCPTVDI